MSEMPQTRPIQRGDRVILRPEWRDPGDETLGWIACDDEEKGRVTIMPINLGLPFPPRQTVKTDMLYPVLEAPEFVIFSASEAMANDDGAGFWSNEFGWTTLEQATRFDQAGGLMPISAGNDAVWMVPPYGLQYTVLDVVQEGENESIRFPCWAEDADHAKEQAENAYPGSRVLGTEAEQFKPFRLVIDAYALDEWGDGPLYAIVTVNQAFLDRLQRLHRLCVDEKLESASISAWPDEWNGDDELHFRGDSMHVWSDGRFWFSTRPKHAEYQCECRGVDIEQLCAIAKAGPDVDLQEESIRWLNGVLYVAGNETGLKDLIELIEETAD